MTMSIKGWVQESWCQLTHQAYEILVDQRLPPYLAEKASLRDLGGSLLKSTV